MFRVWWRHYTGKTTITLIRDCVLEAGAADDGFGLDINATAAGVCCGSADVTVAAEDVTVDGDFRGGFTDVSVCWELLSNILTLNKTT